ncbi:MAG: ORC1-type DNA replication protein [Methanosarcinaceae archaeon]|nr:ORC1-type DNA replication protein [Methanosarcinaceae archaeon]
MRKEGMLMWDETIFRNPELFELDYLPDRFPHRDTQLDSIRYAIKPALRNTKPLNCLLYGPPGTGKTSASMKIFQELEDFSDKIVTVKINCQIDSTRFAVMARLYQKILGVTPPGSGISFNRIFEKVITKLVETDRTLIAVLDDINYLFYEGNANEVMYSLLRAHEQYPGSRIGVIAIVNDPTVIYGFDPRVASVFLPEEIEFKPYDLYEIDDILSDRIDMGFYPNVVSEDVKQEIVRFVAETGDLRSGIDLLKRSGMNAEKRASTKISSEDVKNAYEASRSNHFARLVKNMNENEQIILKAVHERSEISSGELYEIFNSLTNIGYTRFYEIVNKMVAAGYINAEFTGKGQKGRTRIFKPAFKTDDIKFFK